MKVGDEIGRQLHKVEPRFNEVPRDWANWFVKSRVPALYRKSRYNEFVEKQQKCSLYRGIVNN